MSTIVADPRAHTLGKILASVRVRPDPDGYAAQGIVYLAMALGWRLSYNFRWYNSKGFLCAAVEEDCRKLTTQPHSPMVSDETDLLKTLRTLTEKPAASSMDRSQWIWMLASMKSLERLEVSKEEMVKDLILLGHKHTRWVGIAEKAMIEAGIFSR